MSLDALTTADDGPVIDPTKEEDWQEWVSTTATQNYIVQDPLLDWLDLHGEQHSFRHDTAYPDYDVGTDYTLFITEQGRRFGEAVVRLLCTRTDVVSVATSSADLRNLAKAEETFEAIAPVRPSSIKASSATPSTVPTGHQTFSFGAMCCVSYFPRRSLPRRLLYQLRIYTVRCGISASSTSSSERWVCPRRASSTTEAPPQ